MIVGLTYDLKDDYLREGFSPEDAAEFDSIETIDAIDAELHAMGHETVRIGNLKNLVHCLARGQRWDFVFNIAEGVYGFGREAQVPALLEAYQIPHTFSDSLVMALALHKGMAKRIVRSLGIPTPDFAVVERLEDLRTIDLPYPLFVKPVAEGTGKGITVASQVLCARELRAACAHLLERFQQPVLVEVFLPGREFTVGILGTGAKARAIGVMEICRLDGNTAEPYSLDLKSRWSENIGYQPVRDEMGNACADLALRAWRGLGCRDGGRVDIRTDSNSTLYFLEANPLAGLRPAYSDLCVLADLHAFPYGRLIREIVSSTSERVAVRIPPPSTRPGNSTRAAPAKLAGEADPPPRRPRHADSPSSRSDGPRAPGACVLTPQKSSRDATISDVRGTT